MSRFSKTLMALLLVGGASASMAFDRYPNLGRLATPAEVKAWDIDVRPDFTGLPQGSGNVDDGMVLWEAKCASCHGIFGESNEVFTPIVGGTRVSDIETGRVAALVDNSFPQRSTFMKVATVSTLFDYIKRAMPWTEPKSLSDDDVYALLAYLLNLAEVVPADFVLTHDNIAEVQARMPNRNGMTTDHGMWPGASAANGGMGNGGKPDVNGDACMSNCKSEAVVASALPEHAQDAHGNLAEQNRPVGPVRGMQSGEQPEAGAATTPSDTAEVAALATSKGCMACHGLTNKIVGPGYNEVLAKYKDRADAEDYLVGKVKSGGQGVWGAVPMPPQGNLSDDEARRIVQWVLSGAQAQ